MPRMPKCFGTTKTPVCQEFLEPGVPEMNAKNSGTGKREAEPWPVQLSLPPRIIIILNDLEARFIVGLIVLLITRPLLHYIHNKNNNEILEFEKQRFLINWNQRIVI